MLENIYLVPLLPLIGFLINGFFGKRFGRTLVGIIACSAIGLSFVVSVVAFFELLGLPADQRIYIKPIYTWIASGNLNIPISFHIDPLSIVMMLVVTGVGFLIHVYSNGYMAHDSGYARFFAYLNLFTFAMLILVMADNYLVMFIGWEGVGLCSYLLIGFWFHKDSASNAGMKAFVVNRIGDFAFIIGMVLLFTSIGSLRYQDVFAQAQTVFVAGGAVVTLITLLFFIGAAGKSAQLPLYVWLPDAMEGPTPVSALIHAATMVTAGVYMVARSNVLFHMAPTTMMIVATVGTLTAIFAATIGLVNNDIKRVLAYSTVSQLGYMFLAVGVGAYAAGIFHLMTHAFFKSLLFLGAGSVMHAMSDETDMQIMGGLKKYLPRTYITMLIAAIAIAGIFPLSGFFSKDAILLEAYSSGNIILWIIGSIAAVLTAFYMFRLIFLTFWGDERIPEKIKSHVHESPAVMTVPLMILAGLSIIGGFVGLPVVFMEGGDKIGEFLAPVFSAGQQEGHHVSHALEWGLMGLATLLAVGGIGTAYVFYVKNPQLPVQWGERLKGIYHVLYNKYFVDEIYDFLIVRRVVSGAQFLWRGFDEKVIDGIVNGCGYVLQILGYFARRIQTGVIQNYALMMVLGIIFIMGYYLFQ